MPGSWNVAVISHPMRHSAVEGPGPVFEVGDIVRCVNNSDDLRLTEGGAYVVHRMAMTKLPRCGLNLVDVINDRGQLSNYLSWRFELAGSDTSAVAQDSYEQIIEAQDAYHDALGSR